MFQYAMSLVLRRKLRTILTSLGITIAVILLSLIIFGMRDLQTLITNSFQSQFKPNEVFESNSAGAALVTGSAGGEEEDEEEKPLTKINSELINNLKQKSEVEKISPMTVITSLEGKIDGYDKSLRPSFGSGWDISGEDSYFTEFYGDKNMPTGDEVFVAISFAKLYKLDNPEELIGKKLILSTAETNTFGSIKTKETLDKSFELTIKGVYDPGRDQNDFIMSLDKSSEILANIGGFDSKEEFINDIGYDMMRISVNNDKVVEFKEFLEKDYNFASIFTADDILGFFNQILSAFTLVLIVFGLVSGLVASIGIMNTMVMSIYEQTKEIGIIKSMGASNWQILFIFLVQSGFIGLFGGSLGLLIVFVSMRVGDPYVVEALRDAGFELDHFFNFDLTITLYIVLGSIIIGIISGLYPALKAAFLNPINALRSN